ncbi:MAG TPA: hypothetical protein VMV46_20985 [Thermoanaerobaculia bacterium]|nr:hypothetical protein [Thermoanaerobaculia bacterium]
MRRAFCAAIMVSCVVAITTAPILGQSSRAAEESRRQCNDNTLRGTWGIQIEGTRPSSPGGPVETVVGVVIRQYDGAGTFTQIDNVKGSITGITPDRPGLGTYAVHPDCRVVVVLEPAPGVLIEERLVIVDGGRGAFGVTVQPPPIAVNSVHRRIRD